MVMSLAVHAVAAGSMSTSNESLLAIACLCFHTLTHTNCSTHTLGAGQAGNGGGGVPSLRPTIHNAPRPESSAPRHTPAHTGLQQACIYARTPVDHALLVIARHPLGPRLRRVRIVGDGKRDGSAPARVHHHHPGAHQLDGAVPAARQGHV
eukprot:353021-Chlamydomonas_euryale.AAC.8